MSCLSRIGCLVVVVGAGAAGWWLYGDQLPSTLSRAAGRAADKVSDVSGTAMPGSRTRRDTVSAERGTRGAGARAGDDTSRSDALAWATIVSSSEGATGARSGTGASASPSASALAPLTRRDGPAFVNLGAGELATALGGALPRQLPKSATRVQLALDGDQLLVRAALDATEIAGDGTLGRLLGTALSGRDSVQFGGTLTPLRPGMAQYRVESLRLKGVDVPPRLIPLVIGSLRRGARTDGLDDNAFALPLPRVVADLRLANSRLTLYKAVPAP
ncbi:MAG: hypothetical protein IT354_06915 [Gemmatimonadaceae bacterium]|mgnify:CR=1 FL=1|jgi:hypothetical protein|nr:hypothetical protein [Gemmatimonadaceae bacterium]